MKKSLVLLAAILAVPFVSEARSREAAQIKVISYNIRYDTPKDGPNAWQFRAPASVLMVIDQNPDIFGLQEAKPHQADFLDLNLSNYKYVGVGRDDGKKEGEIMALFYNKKTISLKKWGTFWLSDTPDTPSRGWDAKCFRTATWALLKDKRSGRRFYYVNTHLDHIGIEAREKGLNLILDKIAEMNVKNLPVILTGDFNMKPDSPMMAPVDGRMKNAREVAAVTDHEGTYTAWGKRSMIIDYIYFNGFSSCTEYKTIKDPYMGLTFISDHYPISATLVF